ncbi:uncharacterized protein BDZ99DRAFT_371980, partial [Mytilinidion resinicola]
MASLPPRPASQRRSSPRADEASSSADSHQPLPRTDSEALSTTSEDSQTLLLNRRQSHREIDATELQQKPAPPVATSQAKSNDEPRKCWICFNDETEDDAMSSEWRSPCPCVLVAHEKCLLAWINDVENEKRSSKILCPQCKTEIQVARPRSRIVDAYKTLEHMGHLMLVPSVVFILGSAGYQTARMFGVHAVNEIFGVQDGFRILHTLYDTPDLHEESVPLRILNHLRDHWRLAVGLPVIPTVLIASRTSWADSILPVIPIIFFANTSSPIEGLNNGNWPPSAALTISLLPYIRGAYNAYYERVWAPHEQRWLREISPHTGDTPPEPLDPDNADVGDIVVEEGWGDQGVVLDVDIDFDVFADWNAGGAADNNLADENPPVPIARGPAPPLNAPPQDGDAAPAPQIPVAQPRRRLRRTGISPTALADTVIGALLFPSIAARVGEVLRFALPHSWTTPNGNKAMGLLQTKWGRSIVGGCLFVGIKDAVLLYVRWRMAQNMRQRKVLDWTDDGK